MLILLFLDAFISICFMFYWMYKSKNGELNLKKNSWHVKLLNWMWDFEPSFENACPYYWTLNLSIQILPVFIIFKLFAYFLHFIEVAFSFVPKISFKTKKADRIEKKPSKFKYIYTKSFSILKCSFFILFLLFSLFLWVKSFYIVFLNCKIAFYIIICILIYILFIFLLLLFEKEELNEIYAVPFLDFFKSFFKIICIPFITAYFIISFPIEKIFKIYQNNCPPINWEE